MLLNDQAEIIFLGIPINYEYHDSLYLSILIYAPFQ